MKIYDKAASTLAEALMDYQAEIERDGIITPGEQRVHNTLREAYAYVEETAARQRLAQRIAGGGAIDRRLRGEVRDAIRLQKGR